MQPQTLELEPPVLLPWRLLLAVHRRVHVLRTLHVLPYIGVGAAMAQRAWPAWWQVLCFVGCAVFGRGYLVAMQRLFATPADVANPDIETGAEPLRVPRPVWVAFAAHAALGLVVCAYVLSPLAGHLSWLLVLLIVVYARIRHRTGLSHLLLGLGLGAGPIGAWIGLRGSLGEGSLCALLVSAGVVAWATGFDMLFSLAAALRRPGSDGPRFTRPMRLDEPGVFVLARGLYVLAGLGFVLAGLCGGLGAAYYLGAALAGQILVLAHAGVGPGRTDSLRGAFLVWNFVAGPVLFTGTLISVAT